MHKRMVFCTVDREFRSDSTIHALLNRLALERAYVEEHRAGQIDHCFFWIVLISKDDVTSLSQCKFLKATYNLPSVISEDTSTESNN
jgi:hypothetical protein